MRKNIAVILSVFFSIVAITTIASQPLPKLVNISYADKEFEKDDLSITNPSDSQNLPIILHIIFDEFLSPEAINLNNGRDLQEDMYDLPELYGFRLFGRVYSRHYFSAISMPNMMNAEYDMQTSRSNLEFTQKTKLNKNNYFNDMASHGYNIKVYQTSHINFCANKHVSVCKTFNSFDPKWQFFKEFNQKDKLGYLLLVVMRGFDSSFIATYLTKILHRWVVDGPDLPENFDVPAFPSWFDSFVNDINQVQRGTMIFAHFMAPHAPYLLSKECIINGTGGVGYYLGKHFNFDQEKINQARQEFFSSYYNQAHCVYNKLYKLLDKIDKLDQFSDAIIIVHGDHGSRISIGNHIEDYSQRDFVDNYATFYAIRSPNIQAGYDCRLISLPRLFSHHIRAEEGMDDLENNPQSIYVASKNDSKTFVESNMPDFPCTDRL